MNFSQREADKVSEMLSYRLMEQNLVHVIGVPEMIAKEELLCSESFFAQYGQIYRIVFNKASKKTPQTGVYLTFATPL